MVLNKNTLSLNQFKIVKINAFIRDLKNMYLKLANIELENGQNT